MPSSELLLIPRVKRVIGPGYVIAITTRRNRNEPQRYRFGTFELDTRTGELRC